MIEREVEVTVMTPLMMAVINENGG